jgi:hypothetical protein
MNPIRPTIGAWARWKAPALCLCILIGGHPALAGEAPERAQAAKSDKLAVTPPNGRLLNRNQESSDPATAAAAIMAGPGQASAPRGSPAGKLVDVAVRDDGLWLNSFQTRSMPLAAPACAALSDEIVSGLPAGTVERLAKEELMRQTRVCAVNGSLLVTCYGGAATVSLRPARDGDGCGR